MDAGYPPGMTGLRMICGYDEGQPAWEELLVRDLGGEQFELQATPGLVDGVARGDVIRDLGDGRFEVVRRGGNLAIQVWGDVPDGVAEIGDEVQRLGGLHDGCCGPTLTIFSIPVKVGFGTVEQALSAICARYPELDWCYGNVYADADNPKSALNWWL